MAQIVVAAKKKLNTNYKYAYLKAGINGFNHSDQSIEFKIEWSANGTSNWRFNMGAFIPYSPEATAIEIDTSIPQSGYFRASVNLVDPYGTISFSLLNWELSKTYHDY